MKEQKNNKKTLQIVILSLTVLLIIVFASAYGLSMSKHAANHKLLRTSEYNSAFLSMFPIETFDEEDFMHFRADKVLKLSYVIPDYRSLRHHLKDVQNSGNELRVIYLGVDPDKISAKQVLSLTKFLPGVQFEVLPAYRLATDWTERKDTSKLLSKYREMVSALAGQENIRIFSFFAQEWLISDPGCYSSKLLLTPETAHHIYLYTDELHGYDIKPENIDSLFNEFEKLLTDTRNGALSYPDFSNLDIVFFGDSVIGNFNGHHSIPEVLAAFTKAKVYNCGYGGSSAADETDMDTSLCDMMECYLSGNITSISPEAQAYAGLDALLSDEAAGKCDGRKRLYVFYYGLNDYFKGCPVGTVAGPQSSSYDRYTYVGALESALSQIKKAQPEADILLIAPNYTTYFENGTMVMSDAGSIYLDYVDAVQNLNDAYSLPTLDIYHNVVTEENNKRYLSDGCHPNEYGHYTIARALISFINEYYHPGR